MLEDKRINRPGIARDLGQGALPLTPSPPPLGPSLHISGAGRERAVGLGVIGYCLAGEGVAALLTGQ